MAVSETLNNTFKTTMTSISEFSASLLKCRDILRKDGITGMDSMRTICLYILAKFFNIERCKILGVPEHLAWENIMITLRTKNGGVQHSLEYFKSKEEDSIIYHFDKLFNTQELPFNIKSPNVHKEILEITDRLDLSKFDLHMDVIGYVFEQHLNTGASSSSRDLGQYFTDRSICNYMVELCKPKFKSPGVIESICDPTMGTAGFLTSAVKYFNRLDYSIDWSVQQQQIHGCDLDAKVSGLANVNMFIESNGAKFENILEHDSLHNDLPQSGYDVILANMPFGIKGLKHADVCERVKALKINGTKSEPLFLQLIMASLNKGGRCAVVVPDGVLINSSNLHNGTREYLLDNFELKKVIKMDGTFFMNTGIKPSILFFENTGCSTGPIEFCEVSKGSDGTVTEKTIVTVGRDQLDKEFTLDMRKFIVDDKPKMNTVYPMVKLGDIIGSVSLKHPISLTNSVDGEYDLFSSSMKISKHNMAEFNSGEYLIQGSRGTIMESLYYTNKPFSVSNNVFVFKNKSDHTCLKYVYYYIKLSKCVDTILAKNVIPAIGKDDYLHKIEIPLPPLEVQQQIVNDLDLIYNSKETSLKLADNIKSQMSTLIKSVAGRGFNEVKLGDVCIFNTDNLSKNDNLGHIHYLDLASVKEGYITYSDLINFNDKPSRAQRKVKNNDILWGTVRPLTKSYAYLENIKENTIVSTGFCVIRTKNTDISYPKYIYYLITHDNCVNYLNSSSTGSLYPSFNTETLSNYKIPLPPLEFQQDLVRRLDTLDNQLKSLESIATSAEDNAKYMLESYLTPAISNEPEAIVEQVEEVVQKPKKKLIRKVVKVVE
jgi:type I restriction enzyme, S subunit